jgi:hypothetical protein
MPTTSFLRLRNQVLKILPLIVCFILLGMSLARPIILPAVDIGRHVKNGQLLLAGQLDLLHHNFYSYTHPDYPFINHHWFFGVMSYEIWKSLGFEGLSLAYIGTMLGALFFFVRAALLRGHLPLATFSAFLALPILVDRREIRPEGLSILFMGVYFYLLTKLSLGKIRRREVFVVLTLVQIVWVNSHIFFFMGPLLVAVFLWEGISRGCTVCARSLWPLLGITLLVNGINPSGLAGALTPLNIFKEFGYRLAENQNIFFMMGRFPAEKAYPYYLGLVVITVIGMILAIRIRGWKTNAPFAVLTLFAAFAGLKAVRLMTPFAFFFVPLSAFFYNQIQAQWPHHVQRKIRLCLLALSLVVGIIFASQVRQQPMRIGLAPGVNMSADFFKQAGLKGPVFSNYDIGGYLIYHLADREKVFVDNRQEAFPPDFFKNVYVPMQEDSNVWAKIDLQYGFNVIYFYRHDLTPWGQKFLVDRIEDPQWAPVFVDGYTIIFVKRNLQNQPIIDQFQLPRSMFGVQH